jgi:hypothetical protein
MLISISRILINLRKYHLFKHAILPNLLEEKFINRFLYKTNKGFLEFARLCKNNNKRKHMKNFFDIC